MPEDVRKLAHEVLRAPVTVQANYAVPVSTVAHALYPVEQHLKTALLLELLRHTDTGSVLIFTRTKHRAERLGEQLGKSGYRAASLQGNLSQNRRQAALDGFRARSHHILVATDIAARGIDVSSVSHVINYDMPDTADSYTHRIGRTGRAAKTGDAFTFTTREDGEMVRNIERVLGNRIERRTLEGLVYRKAMPARDVEFARLPREPQPRREQKAVKPSGSRLGASASQKGSEAEKRESASSEEEKRGDPDPVRPFAGAPFLIPHDRGRFLGDPGRGIRPRAVSSIEGTSSQLRTAALLAKGVARDPSAVPAATALRMATLDGGRALGLGDAIGSLEPDKEADMVAVDLSFPETQPVHHPISQLVYAAGRRQVSHVWIAGRPVLLEGRLTTVDLDKIRADAEQWRERIAGE